jgi:FdhD protein
MQIGSVIEVHRYSNQIWQENNVPEMLEHSVTLSVNGRNWLSFLCFPEDLENLAIGFLFTEGIIQSFDEVISTHLCEDQSLIDVWLSHPARRPRKWSHTSGCAGGMTRGMKIDPSLIIHPHTLIQPASILKSMELLYSWQKTNQSVRGLHCSALSDGEKILHAAKDVGRHNTLDKIAGMFLQSQHKPVFLMALTTGRITSEMLTKCARIGTSMIVSRTTPSHLAVKMAEASGITLIGHVHDDSFNVFTHSEIISKHAVNPRKLPELDLPSTFPPRE